MTSTTREKTTKKGSDKAAPAAPQKRSAAKSDMEPAAPEPAKAAAPAPSKAPAPAKATVRPSNPEIAWVAYGLYLQSGGEHGRDLEHWYAAERILSGKP
ncbi:MAG: DUF2934 domain-containing protein [Deltaproteobacteria bacterium]|nr:DUF2934 domain-containing protein [Deltaproteobacteria bacterium]